MDLVPATAAPPRPARRRWRRRPSLGLLLLCLVALVLFVWPVVMLAYGAFRSDAPGQPAHWTSAGLTGALTNPGVWTAFRNSLVISTVTMLLSITVATYLAWLVTRTRTPLRQLVTPMAALIFATPPLFLTLSWAMLGQQPNGLLNKALNALIGVAPINAQSWYGLIGAGVLGASAAQYLLLIGPFRALNPTLEEASLTCGASRLVTFFRIELPILAPSILGVVILGFVLGMGLLTGPLILGQPAGIYVLPTEVYRFINGFTPADYAGASTLALLLVAVVLVLVAAQSRFLGRRQFITVTGKATRREPLDIGRWRWFGAASIVLYAIFGLLLPLGQFVLGSFQPYFGVYKGLTLDNYRAVFSAPGSGKSFTMTVIVAIVAGFVAATLGVITSLVAQRSRSRWRKLPDTSIWVLWAVPGITLSLGLIWAYMSVPGLRQLYATQWIVLIALIIGVTPIATRAVSGSIAQIDVDLEAAARTSGANAFQATAGILVRLIAPSFLASWFLAGVVASGNLDVPILLASPTNQTVPLLAFQYYNNGNLAQSAATFCLLLGGIAAVFVIGGLAGAASRAWRRHRFRPARLQIDDRAGGGLDPSAA